MIHLSTAKSKKVSLKSPIVTRNRYLSLKKKFYIYLIFALLFVPLIPLSAYLFYKAYTNYNHAARWLTGYNGEIKVAKILKKLKNYRVINDVPLKNKTNIDHVVLGKNGIFVIETKNVCGRIYVNGKNWERIKIKNGKKLVVKENPINQARRNAYLLARYIKSKTGKNYPVKAVVVLANSRVKKKIKNSKTPILTIKEINKYIKSYKAKNPISKREIKEIENLIIGLKVDEYGEN